MAPIELFKGTKLPTLEGGNKSPNCTSRIQKGQFLGYSPEHSPLVCQIMNMNTALVNLDFIQCCLPQWLDLWTLLIQRKLPRPSSLCSSLGF